jgi:hypothetical protein
MACRAEAGISCSAVYSRSGEISSAETCGDISSSTAIIPGSAPGEVS